MTSATRKLKIPDKVFVVPVVNVISSLIPEIVVLSYLQNYIVYTLRTHWMRALLYSFTAI